MEYRQLGKTGLTVSAFSLGCGGNSALGLRRGATIREAQGVVRAALDLGVTLFDTAPAYNTEEIVGAALRSVPRDEVVLSTKVHPHDKDGQLRKPEDLRQSLQDSLTRLQTDYVDVFYLHGVETHEYEACRDALAPALERLRDDGLIRCAGVTESFIKDTRHEMLAAAVEDTCWDACMVGFNVLNPSARGLFERTRENGIGVVIMQAVRWVLASGARLAEHLDSVDLESASAEVRRRVAALRPYLRNGDADRLPGAAYWFAVSEPGVDSVLIGTGTPAHLEANVQALAAPADADPFLEALEGLFEDAREGTGDPMSFEPWW